MKDSLQAGIEGQHGCCQSNANQSLKLQATSLSGRQLVPFCQGS